ncbi:Hypothetical predicted protein [Podarcis lilfordi]|uniref:Uncharacterized protein n=1 Tax=Podarcis lilfordi TaxID=74358 RepID=A0AA35K8L9_9SAUR|nr:Hypothetical predicted protein [Podarcis lilfordi]
MASDELSLLALSPPPHRVTLDPFTPCAPPLFAASPAHHGSPKEAEWPTPQGGRGFCKGVVAGEGGVVLPLLVLTPICGFTLGTSPFASSEAKKGQEEGRPGLLGGVGSAEAHWGRSLFL